MKNILKKISVLLGIFIIAVVTYFIWAQKNNESKHSEIIYTSMEEASLPVVYVSMFGKNMNPLHGYLQDMKQMTARESLTILPSDRMLNIQIEEYGSEITGIQYEIRSLDLERLVERTMLKAWDSADGRTTAVLPIQNLLSKEQEYLLDLCINTSSQGAIHYYTRIIWTDNENTETMVNFAGEFAAKTFDHEKAGELATYMEPNSTGDNSTLARVTIHSSFSQITWGGLDMQLLGEPTVTLKELNGIMAEVQLNYLVSRKSGEEEKPEVYEVTDHYTMKWSTQRIYLMNYTREMNQIFAGTQDLFSGKRIILGIANEDVIQLSKSPNQQKIAFVINRDLWSYSQSEEEAEAVKVFSFRSGKDDGVRSGYNQHDINILSVQDNGDIDFLVYGYMNRGMHEGNMGVALYRYQHDLDAIEEKFFAPAVMSFEALKQDLEQLAYLGPNDMFYMLIDHAIYGIDLKSNESMVVADALREGSYAVSQDEKQLAWQEGDDLYSSQIIHLMDLYTGKKQEITGQPGELLRVLGFVGSDFIYGLAREGDQWIENGRSRGLPMYSLEILGDNMEVESRYEKEGLYISSVDIQGSRIHINQISKAGGQLYTAVGEDTLVCNAEVEEPELEGIGWYTSSDREKLMFVQLNQERKGNRPPRIVTPGKVSSETTGILELKANTTVAVTSYCAYGGGKLIGITEDFTKAIGMAYDQMGLVTDDNQRILWNRVNRSPARTIKDPVPAATKILKQIESGESTGNMTVLDARGCSLNQVLYFIDKGNPVIAYTGDGVYTLISGFDQYNITLYDPNTGDSSKMGLNDAAGYFGSLKNDFVCGIVTQ